ncbi:YifB family Mg chelatase-like AAA ATPase [Timonella sp. A28]|uniref:YifB family Mg chelatase-like AAA ATPase n=1 Tax=Timonella sp. A28 TaxID=3442640 RepID=UPI003EB92D62
MAIGYARTIALLGVHGHNVTVEAHVTSAIPAFTIIGLPDASLSEARDRVRAAIASAGIEFPQRKITVNLAPASLPKSGSTFDLAIAVAILVAVGALHPEHVRDTMFIGELGLDSQLHPVRGVLPAVHAASQLGVSRVVVPAGNAAEAELVQNVDVVPVKTLGQCIRLLGGEAPELELYEHAVPDSLHMHTPSQPRDMSEVVGQESAKYAVEIAAAGGHNLMLIGPPGTGKTMLAQRIVSVLPELTPEQALETASIHSLCGTFSSQHGISTLPPFENPHHTATGVAIIGGGSGTIRPGAVSRAHHGILFLDEAPEFSARTLQTLRQPIESGEVVIQRSVGTATFPARFQLVIAANPCPCGNAHGSGKQCVCTSLQRRRYMNRLSGPLLDRVDIQVDVLPVAVGTLHAPTSSSAEMKERITQARQRAHSRYADLPWHTNAQAHGTWIRNHLGKTSEAIKEVNHLTERGRLSLRGADRVLRVAATIADLSDESIISVDTIHTALALRTRAGDA